MPKGITPDERFDEWIRQLERITQEVYAIHHHRQLWRELAAITDQANLPPSLFFDVLGLWYAVTQSTAIRRQLDTRSGTVSLIRLLQDLERHPGIITRDRHVQLWTAQHPLVDLGDGDTWQPFLDEANSNYTRFAGSPERDHLDRTLVHTDIENLKTAGGVVKRLVDETIAHAALSRQQEDVTYADLNTAADTVSELVARYTSLLKAEMIWRFEPVIQEDWTAIFRQPWIT